jgi:phosphoglucosamine mutase
VFARDGYKLPDHVEAEMEALMASPELDSQRAAPADVGYSRKIEDARGRYVVYCKATFPSELTLDGLRIVVDGANGAAYRVGPAVFEELGAKVVAIHTNPNGKNINARAGALHPQIMAETVRNHDAHIGIAFDGDADRLVLCDEHGNIIDGDAVMALCATRMIQENELKKKTVVATVMSNIGLERSIADLGGRLVRAQVGDRYVVEEMRKHGYNLGGEQSGHLVFLDHATTGDGIVAALRVLAIMAREGKPLSELAQVMTRTPQVLINTSVEKKVPLDQLLEVQKIIKAVEKQLGDDGRVLVRYSGTESKVRVMIEGMDQSKIQGWAEEITAELQKSCRA